MKTARAPLVALLVSAVTLTSACSPADSFSRTDPNAKPAASTAQAAQPAGQQNAMPQVQAAAAGSLRGTVAETMDAGGYTYVLLSGPAGQAWAAAPECDIAVGTEVAVSTQMPMRDFVSDSLGRSFDLVYFVGEIDVLGAGGGAASASPHGAGQPGAAVAVETMAPAEGGRSIASIFAESADLAGQAVVLRGKVVKYNSGILGRNWLHVQDGTGEAGTNDLTITTDDSAAVGDTVLVRGTLALDRDFGAGYSYDVIVEEARVTVQ